MFSTQIVKFSLREAEVFWGEMSPCEHLVQIYEDDDIFLDSLEGFIAGGIVAGDGVVVIATPQHLLTLNQRLTQRGVNVASAIKTEQYIALDAETTLSMFMINGWPDDILFNEMVTNLLARAKGNGCRVRAFGEMVALLWAQGNNSATIRLEHLWHRLCNEQSFSLFCAYPRSGFTRDASASIKEVCDTHSRGWPDHGSTPYRTRYWNRLSRGSRKGVQANRFDYWGSEKGVTCLIIASSWY